MEKNWLDFGDLDPIFKVTLGLRLLDNGLTALYLLKNWLCWGLTTRQPLWVILCRLPEKGRKVIEEIVEEIKERDREERNRNESGETEENKNIPHLPLPATSSRPGPTVSLYQLDAPVT